MLCCVVLSHYAAKSLQSCPTLYNPIDGNPSGFSVHRDSLGKDTGVGCHALLLGIFPTQGLNPGPPYCRRILYHLSHKLSPRVLKCTRPFSTSVILTGVRIGPMLLA